MNTAVWPVILEISYSQPSLSETPCIYFYSITFLCSPKFDTTGAITVTCGHAQDSDNVRDLQRTAQPSSAPTGTQAGDGAVAASVGRRAGVTTVATARGPPQVQHKPLRSILHCLVFRVSDDNPRKISVCLCVHVCMCTLLHVAMMQCSLIGCSQDFLESKSCE